MPTSLLRATLHRATRSRLTYAWLAIAAAIALFSAWSSVRYTLLSNAYLPPADLLVAWTERALLGVSAHVSFAAGLLTVSVAQLYCDDLSTGFIKNLLINPASRTGHTLSTFAVLAIQAPLYLLVCLLAESLAALVWGLPLGPLFDPRALLWYAQALAGMFAMGCVGLLAAHLCRRIGLTAALFLFHGAILTEFMRLLNWFEPVQPLLRALRDAVYIPSVLDVWNGVPTDPTWLVLVPAAILLSIAASLLLANKRSVA